MVLNLKRVFDDLAGLETYLCGALDARLRVECDLSMSWFDPMRIIALRPSCRVFDIADELAITIGGISKLVDRIEAAGYCRRRPNPSDGRSSIVELTPSGRETMSAATRIVEGELHARIGAVLSPRALRELHAAVIALRAADGADETKFRSA